MGWHASTDIDASAAVVWSVLMDIRRWPEWSETMTKVEPLGAGGMAIGAKARVTQPRLGRNVWEVTELDSGRSFTWQSRRPGVLTVATHTIEPAQSGGVTVTLGIDQSGALSGALGSLLGGLTQRYLQTEVAGLKRRSEAG